MASAWEGLKADVLGASLSVHGFEIDYPTNEQICYLLEGRELALVRELLGKNWQAWKEEHPKRKDLESFVLGLWEALGVTEAQASMALGLLVDDKYCARLESDLAGIGIPLGDFVKEKLSFRRLAILVDGLDIESKTMRAAAGPVAEWTRQEYFLADILDALNFVITTTHVLCQIQGLKKPLRAPKPMYERPMAKHEKREFTPIADAKAFFGSI